MEKIEVVHHAGISLFFASLLLYPSLSPSYSHCICVFESHNWHVLYMYIYLSMLMLLNALSNATRSMQYISMYKLVKINLSAVATVQFVHKMYDDDRYITHNTYGNVSICHHRCIIRMQCLTDGMSQSALNGNS